MIGISILASGCISTDESLSGLPLRAEQYHPIEHLPPVPAVGEPLLTDVMKIHDSLRNHEFVFARDELDRQIATCQASETENSILTHYLVLRGLTHFALDDPEGALSDYNAALGLDKECWPAYFHRWQCHLELGNRAAANSDREQGRKLMPEKFERDYNPHPAGGVI